MSAANAENAKPATKIVTAIALRSFITQISFQSLRTKAVSIHDPTKVRCVWFRHSRTTCATPKQYARLHPSVKIIRLALVRCYRMAFFSGRSGVLAERFVQLIRGLKFVFEIFARRARSQVVPRLREPVERPRNVFRIRK